MAVGAGRTSSTTRGANVERDAHDFVSKESVDPLSLLIGDESLRISLVISVRVWFPAEVASEGRLCLVGPKGRGKVRRLVSSAIGVGCTPAL